MQQTYRIARIGLQGLVLPMLAAWAVGCEGGITSDDRKVGSEDSQLGSAGSGSALEGQAIGPADTACYGSSDGYDNDGYDGSGGDYYSGADDDAACQLASVGGCPWGYVEIIGTDGDDTLIGTGSRDCILGLGGNDVINGKGGSDLLVGGAGDDEMYGEGGEDTILGGDGDDEIKGGGNDDWIEGGAGNDHIDAGKGSDIVQGGMCHDTIGGGGSFDYLRGNAGSDRIPDSSSHNSVNGGSGTDACSGTSCEVWLSAPQCTSDAQCSSGKRCVVATGICVAAGSVAFTDPTCDGVDDDCDGAIDEEFPAEGEPVTCGMGACERDGTITCEDGEVVESCEPGMPAANDATCNAIDEDCNGQSDEDFVSHSTTCGAGACAATGSTSCVGGVEHDSCTPGGGAPSDATCDGVDDDCSGQSDEDYVATMTVCGLGICASTGVTSCVGGMEQNSCTPGTPASSDATCDAVDEDCNGQSDEDFVSGSTSCGVGACAASGSTSCVLGSVQDSCTPGTPGADDATCDGADDDCDGAVDEDFQASCSNTTRITCAGGQLQTFECADGDACNGVESCSAGACVPGTPVDTDDGDPCTADDCDPADGSVTHTPVPVGTSCSDGLTCNGEELCLTGSAEGCVSLPTGAVAWWRGEGNADDSAGSNDGTLSGATFTAGQVAQAFSFDGLDDSVGLNAHAAVLNLAGTATLEFWMRSTSDTCRTVFSMRQDATHEQFLQIGNNCNATLINELVTWRYVNGAVSSTVGFVTSTRTTLLDNNWHHVAVSFDGTNTRIYIDGVARTVTIATGTDHGDWGALPAPTTATLGARDTGALSSFFFGNLDEVTLYDRALSAAEVAAIHLAGSAGKCDAGGGGGGGLTCTDGPDAPAGTMCEDGGTCDGAGSCL